MAFDPKKYKPTKQKVLPVVLLLDVSGSMSGAKIESLYQATLSMIKSFDEQKIREVQIQLAIITFGNTIELHTPFSPVENLNETKIGKFVASGMTPLGVALTMAKDMLEDKDILPRPRYKPAVVLVSDGYPNDEWRGPLDRFISGETTSKCERFSVGIGQDYDFNVMKLFASNEDCMFTAEDSDEIGEKFKLISSSISMRSKSINPNKSINSNKVETDGFKTYKNEFEEDKSKDLEGNFDEEEDEYM